MKNGILFLFIISSFSLFAQDKINTFTYLEIDGPIEVELVQSDVHKIEILETPALVKWEINGSSLVVRAQYKEAYDRPKVRIHIKELKKLHLFGQVILGATGTFEARRMNIQLNSQSIANLAIDTEDLDVKISQQSILNLSGIADEFSIEANQQSVLQAKEVQSSRIDVMANNQSVVNIRREGATLNSTVKNESIVN